MCNIFYMYGMVLYMRKFTHEKTIKLLESWILNPDTHHLPNSKTLYQSNEPSYQDYSICKSARKSNHDIQQLPAKNKAFSEKQWGKDLEFCFW